MAKLTFYGGVEEIGGNKIILEDRDTRILIDFGMSFADRRRFYADHWLSPRGENQLLGLGIRLSAARVELADKLKPCQISG